MAESNVLPHDGTPLGIAEIKLMLMPLTNTHDSNHGGVAISVRGSDAQARACKLLCGRGLPGDPGCNKTSYFFKLNDGRKVAVYRHVYKNPGPLVFVRVSKTAIEIKAEREAYMLEAEIKRQEKSERMTEVKERMASPEVFRRRMEHAISDLESYISVGNQLCLADENMPSTYRLDCDDQTLHLVKKLKSIVCNCRIKPIRSLRLVAPSIGVARGCMHEHFH